MSRLASLCCAVALLLPATTFAQGVSPQKRTEGFIAALLKVKADDGKLTKADRDANQKVFSELDTYFDWDYLVSSPIQPRVDKFTPAEKADYTKKFKELVRLIAYPDSGSFFKKAKYTVGAPKEDKEITTVPIDAKVIKDDLETKVDIHWVKSADGLRIRDVSFDGDSLIRDYQNQFVRIIDKEGAKGLIGKIDKRRAELEQPKK